MSSTLNITSESYETVPCAEDAACGLGDAASHRGSEAAALEMDVMATEPGNVVLPGLDNGQIFPPELGHAEHNDRERLCPLLNCDTCMILICAFLMLSVVGLCVALVIWVFLRRFSTLDN